MSWATGSTASGSASPIPAITEVLACMGYDFVVIDQEHGAGSLGDAVAMLRACDAAGCPAIVRVPWNDQVYLKRILDVGAQSLMIPMVETAGEAAAAVAACRYPPAGRRGYAAPSMRCSRYGRIEDYIQGANAQLLIICQIESAAAAGRAAEIAGVDGVDMVLIGVNDLAGSIGRLERLGEPEVDALVRQAEAGRPQGRQAAGHGAERPARHAGAVRRRLSAGGRRRRRAAAAAGGAGRRRAGAGWAGQALSVPAQGSGPGGAHSLGSGIPSRRDRRRRPTTREKHIWLWPE